jgi:hypothetical protein
MTEKQLKLVITFQTTAAAMTMEKACNHEGAPGRLVPVPLEISDGCGLAWLAKTENRDELLRIAQAHGVQTDKIIEMEL